MDQYQHELAIVNEENKKIKRNLAIVNAFKKIVLNGAGTAITEIASTQWFEDLVLAAPELIGMDSLKKEDIIKSLMFMISFNIGQMAYLTSVIHDIDDIYFVGNYIRDNNIGKEKITFAKDLMSQK